MAIASLSLQWKIAILLFALALILYSQEFWWASLTLGAFALVLSTSEGHHEKKREPQHSQIDQSGDPDDGDD